MTRPIEWTPSSQARREWKAAYRIARMYDGEMEGIPAVTRLEYLACRSLTARHRIDPLRLKRISRLIAQIEANHQEELTHA